MKKFCVTLLLVFCSFGSFAQQDVQYTMYMFNSLVYNPAYAGSLGYLSGTLIHRQQWVGFDGAPQTQSLTLHSPLANDRVGVGLSVTRDVIGPTNSIDIQMAYAYHIEFGNKMKLGLGIQGGVKNWRADWTKVSLLQNMDDAFKSSANYWLPNFGAGLFFYSDKFYLGASVPHLIDNDLRRDNVAEDDFYYARQYRHYVFTGGIVVPIASRIKFKPSFVIQNVGLFGEFRGAENNLPAVSAPTKFDVDVAFFFNEVFGVGAAFRSAFEAFNGKSPQDGGSSIDSGDLWVTFLLKNNLRIGLAYDYTLTKIGDKTPGSYEIMIGYDLKYDQKGIVTPRYF